MGDKSTFRIMKREANHDTWASKYQGGDVGELVCTQNPKSGPMIWEPGKGEKTRLKHGPVLVAGMSQSRPETSRGTQGL